MEVREASTTLYVACAIRKWAVEKGLVTAFPGSIEANLTGGVEPIQASVEIESLLRQKMLLTIAYNERTRCIFIYTKKKVYNKDLKTLPTTIHGCGIAYTQGDVDEIGKVPNHAQGAAFSVVVGAQGVNRYACGSSISPGNSRSAGTLGALVRDEAGVLYGLSNNHVTGLCSHSSVGVPILAPGVLDVDAGRLHPFTIGLHKSVIEMNVGTQGNIDIARNSDAALFTILNDAVVSSLQGGLYDTPTLVEDPIEGMTVEKVGRTTGHTRGKIVGRELGPLTVSCTAAEFSFSGHIMFENTWIVHGDGEAFSTGGDSGSLIVSVKENGDRAAVGLLFAGGQDAIAPGNQRTFFLPIRPILERLGVQLVGGHHAELGT
ncbi:hypothetical protein AA042_21740 [Pseudomonas lundensis]|uniref:hypothetical protein n=1 Tax=Pseudomonas lundensis TaxID=86185 RepID=UPI00069A7627|nr:hypothetical protein [Pseudomonas lundensis]AOZ14975.1 hypothetical protein AA042_21740 [Pseudomonas lundensis]QVQ77740.1 hypothetical protein KIN24_01095 [Pseudomonas lundensis]QVQ83191.1 hypothetical protein KIY13_08350 [Pseudomonas lundensis]